MSEDQQSPRTRTARDSDDTGVRLRLYEERTDARLREGATAMATMRAAIAEIKPKPRSAWPFVTFGFAVALAFGGWIWQAARYPDRQDLAEVNRRIEMVNGKLIDIVLEQEKIRGALVRLQEAKRR